MRNLMITFSFYVEWVPQLTITLGWFVKIKSIQELEWNSMCVASDASWLKLCKDVRASKRVHSAVVLFSFHQDEDLALKSSRIIVNKDLDEAVLLKRSSKLDQKFWNSILSWLGDLQATIIYPLQFC